MVRSVHFDIHVNCITHFYPHEYTELFDELGKNPLIPFWMEEQEKSFEDLARMANHLEYATVNKNVSKFYLDTMSYVSSLSTPSIRRYLPFWISLDRVIEEILKMGKINNKHPGLFAIMHSSETP